MEMVIQGVSTRKVANITEELCSTEFSQSTVDELCKILGSCRAGAEQPSVNQSVSFCPRRRDVRQSMRGRQSPLQKRHPGGYWSQHQGEKRGSSALPLVIQNRRLHEARSLRN